MRQRRPRLVVVAIRGVRQNEYYRRMRQRRPRLVVVAIGGVRQNEYYRG